MSERQILAADIGGTKSLLELRALAPAGARTLARAHYFNDEFSGAEALIARFVDDCGGRATQIDAACLAVAGPVRGRSMRLTNRPWQIDADALASRFGIARLSLVNDFAAVGHGIRHLADNELLTLQQGRPVERGVCAVIGAGTGLGMSALMWHDGGWHVLPSEGGNTDFPPVGERQGRLWSFLTQRFGRASCNNILSGHGLEIVYWFLELAAADPNLRVPPGAQAEHPGAAAITERALDGSDPRAVEAVDLFLEVYGAVAGNLALLYMAQGGVYVAGGIAPRIAALFARSRFLAAFRAKGKFADMMPSFPVRVVLTAEVGLRGALALAAEASA